MKWSVCIRVCVSLSLSLCVSGFEYISTVYVYVLHNCVTTNADVVLCAIRDAFKVIARVVVCGGAFDRETRARRERECRIAMACLGVDSVAHAISSTASNVCYVPHVLCCG